MQLYGPRFRGTFLIMIHNQQLIDFQTRVVCCHVELTHFRLKGACVKRNWCCKTKHANMAREIES